MSVLHRFRDIATLCHSKVTQSYQQYYPLLGRLNFLPETGKVPYTYFQTIMAEMSLKTAQGHWRRRNSISHISLSISGL